MKALIIIPIIALMFFMAPGETVNIPQIPQESAAEATGATITPQTYLETFNLESKHNEGKKQGSENTDFTWRYIGRGMATYYAPGWRCWEGIIWNHKNWGHLPGFEPSDSCFYLATIYPELMGHKFILVSEDSLIIATQVDVVAPQDIYSFTSRGRVFDISYKAAETLGCFNCVLSGWVLE